MCKAQKKENLPHDLQISAFKDYVPFLVYYSLKFYAILREQGIIKGQRKSI